MSHSRFVQPGLIGAAALWALLVVVPLPAQVQTLTVRLSFKRVLGPGNIVNPAWTAANLTSWVAQTNAAYAKSGIQFAMTEFTDLPDPGTPSSWFNVVNTDPSVLAQENAAKATPSTYIWRNNAINIYLANTVGTLGGLCSFATFNPGSHRDIIFIVPNIANGAMGLAHELGHYLDLLHTFETAQGVETPGTCPQQSPNGTTAGDLILDTPADPNVLSSIQTLYACNTTWFNAVRFNVMSYYQPISSAQAVFTPGQMSVMYKTAKEYRSAVIQPFHQEMRKVMITEVSWGDPDCVEIANFGTTTVNLANWRLVWKEFGTAIPSSPLGISLAPGEVAVIQELGSPPPVPPGVQVVQAWTTLSTSSNEFAVALRDGNDATEDEVRISNTSGTYLECGLGGYFSGLATRTASTGYGSVERYWGLDSDSGADWTECVQRTMGLENSSNGPRGTDPRTAWTVRINETDDDPDYIELLVQNTTPVNFQHWSLWCGSGQGLPHSVIAPFDFSLSVANGGFLVIGEDLAGPPERPVLVPYMVLPAGQGIPWANGAYDCALYDLYGRCVDVMRTTADSTKITMNHPRAPSAPSDFTGTAGRVNGGDGAVARVATVDHNRGSDWRAGFNRTMGFANPSFTTPQGNGHALDVRFNRGHGPGGFTLILNAGAAFAGHRYSFFGSFSHMNGYGPFFGIGGDAVANYYAFAAIPGIFGALDATGWARLDFPAGSLPPGLGTDNVFILQTPAGAVEAITDIIQYDS